MFRSVFALALGLFFCYLIFSAYVSWSLTHKIELSYRYNIFINSQIRLYKTPACRYILYMWKGLQ